MTVLWFIYYKHFSPHFYNRIWQNSFYTVINAMLMNTALFIHFMYLLSGDYLKNTHKLYTVSSVCLLSSHLISQNIPAFNSA